MSSLLPHHAIDLELPAAAVGLGDHVEDEAGGKRERRAQHEGDGEHCGGQLAHEAGVEVLGDDRHARNQAKRDEDDRHPAEERHGAIVAKEAHDGGEHEHAVGKGGELALGTFRAVAIVDGDVDDAPAVVDRPDRYLGLDLEALRHHGHRLHERARAGAVTGHDVVRRMAIENADKPSHEVVAELVEASPVLIVVGSVGDAIAHRHVGVTVDDGSQQLLRRLRGVRVVTVNHEVVVGVDVAKHRAHDIALALARLVTHHRTCRGGNGGGVVGGGVVVDVDGALGQGVAKVAHDLGDGGGFVVARDEDSYADAAKGGRTSIGLCGNVEQGVVFHKRLGQFWCPKYTTRRRREGLLVFSPPLFRTLSTRRNLCCIVLNIV